MSALGLLPSFHFAGYTLRPTQIDDLQLARAWNDADPDHVRTTQPSFWIVQSTCSNSYLLEDQDGAVFFFKMVLAGRRVEVHIQFPPGTALAQSRVRHGLRLGIQWLEKQLISAGFDGYFFHSRNPSLVVFCENRLGFEWNGRSIFKNLNREGGSNNVRAFHSGSNRTHDAQGHSGQIREGHA